MELSEITKNLLAAKKEKSLSFADLETVVGRMKSGLRLFFIGRPALLRKTRKKLYLPWDLALMQPKRLPNAP
jgi:cyanate lyase